MCVEGRKQGCGWYGWLADSVMVDGQRQLADVWVPSALLAFGVAMTRSRFPMAHWVLVLGWGGWVIPCLHCC